MKVAKTTGLMIGGFLYCQNIPLSVCDFFTLLLADYRV